MSDPRTASVTYAEVGVTLDAEATPAGFRLTGREVALGTGRAVFDRAVADTREWQIQRRSGIRVQAADGRADAPPLGLGDTVIMRVPLWPFPVPCRVVATVDEPRRAGFAYGTLPGHPESGEEAFLIEWLPDDRVVVRIRAFSKPASWLFRLGYPAVLLMQRIYTDRYARALVRAPR